MAKKKSDTASKNAFQPLTPIVADVTNYKNCLEYIFKSADLRNIALSGPYGSGKSSVMLGIEAEFPKEEFLHISLAHFEASDNPCEPMVKQNGEEPARESCKKEAFSENVIEGKILNQLIHQLKPSKIPRSRFRKTKKTRPYTGLPEALILSAFLASTAALLNFGLLEKHAADAVFSSKILAALLFVWCLSLVLGLLLVFRKRVFKGALKRIGFLGGDIEVFEEGEGSCFDRHLDDILYMIESSGASVFVFEDLDRFGKPEIFEKLREINSLANSQPSRPNRWRIERIRRGKKQWGGAKKSPCVRFFYLVGDDLFNAYERVKFFDFIIPVVPYIDANSSEGVLSEKLEKAAKGLDPSFLEEISTFIEDPRILGDIINEYQIYRSNLPQDLFGEAGQHLLLGLMAYKILFPADFARLQKNEGYVYDLLHSRIKDVRKKLVASGQQAEYVSSLDAAGCIALLGTDEFFEWETGKGQKHCSIAKDKHFELIHYLIGNGIVDESYTAYMSLFHEARLSQGDEHFRKNVLIKKACDPGFKLDDPYQVARRLQSHRLAQPAARNYALLSCLLNSDEQEKISSFFEGLKKDDDAIFLLGYAESNSYNPSIFDCLPAHWNDCIALIEDASLPLRRRRHFIHLMMSADSEMTRKNEALIADFANRDSSFLCTNDEIANDSFKEALLGLPYCAKEIDFENANRSLVELVIENGLHITEPEFICKLLVNGCGISEDKVEKGVLATILTRAESGSLEAYVANKLPEIMAECVSDASYAVKDDEETILLVLNNASLKLEIRTRYAEAIAVAKVSNIGDVEEKSLWKTLMKHDAVEFTEENVYEYYRHLRKNFDDALIGFLNRNAKSGVLTLKGQELFFDGLANFATNLIARNDLSDEAFALILPEYGYVFNSLQKTDLSAAKIEALASSPALEMNASNLRFIRNNYKDSIPTFYKTHPEKYAEVVSTNQVPFDQEEEHGFLLCSSAEEHIKIASLGTSGQHEMSVDGEYSDEVNIAIIEEHFNADDLDGKLSDLYGYSGENLDKAIVGKYAGAIKASETEMLVSFELMVALLQSEFLSENEKKLLIANSIGSLTDAQVGICLNAMGNERYLAVWAGRPRKMRVCDSDSALIKAMEEHGYCGEIESVGEDAKEFMLNGLFERSQTAKEAYNALVKKENARLFKALSKRSMSLAEIAKLLNVSKRKAAKSMDTLTNADLIRKYAIDGINFKYHLP